jgi:hypothetical protein
LSRFYYLTDQDILEAVNKDSQKLRAYSLDSTSSFAVLVIPAASLYANGVQFSAIKLLFSQRGIKLCPYKAAGTDDIHIYIFFTRKIDTGLINQTLTNLLVQSGLAVSSQSIFAYPSDSPLPFPLQRGFAWLDENLRTCVHRSELTTEQALELFVTDRLKNRCSFEGLITQVDPAPDHGDKTDLKAQPLEPAVITSAPLHVLQDSAVDLQSFQALFEPDAWRLLSDSLELDLDRATVDTASKEPVQPLLPTPADPVMDNHNITLINQPDHCLSSTADSDSSSVTHPDEPRSENNIQRKRSRAENLDRSKSRSKASVQLVLFPACSPEAPSIVEQGFSVPLSLSFERAPPGAEGSSELPLLEISGLAPEAPKNDTQFRIKRNLPATQNQDPCKISAHT